MKRIPCLLLNLLCVLLVGLAYAKEPVTLRYSSGLGPDLLPTLRQRVERFEELNPDIKVALESRAGGFNDDKLLAQLLGGDIPDVIHHTSDVIPRLISEGLLLDVTALVERDLDRSEYVPWLFEETVFLSQGRYYGGLETHFQTRPIFYNADKFAAAGVATPNQYAAEGRWDWLTFASVARKFTRSRSGDSTIDEWGFSSWGNQWQGWGTWVFLAGERVFAADGRSFALETKETIEALDFFFSMYTDEDYAVPQGDAPFRQGVAAMTLSGSWAFRRWELASLGFEWDVALPPANTPDWLAMATAGANGIILSGTKHPEEAWRFVRFLLSEEAQMDDGITRMSMPVLFSALRRYVTPTGQPASIQIMSEMAQRARVIRRVPAFTEAMRIAGEEFGKVFAGAEPVEAAVANLVRRANPVLAEAVDKVSGD